MKKSVLIGVATAIGSGLAHAQNHNLTNPANVQENMNAIVRGAAAVGMDNRYEGLQGTPYAFARWLPATVTTQQKKTTSDVWLKYDAFRQHLLLRDLRTGDSLQLDDNLVAVFVLHDANKLPAQHEFRRFLESPDPAQRREFVEVLHQGRYALLKRYGKKLRAANYKGAYNAADQRADELLDEPAYYLLSPNTRLVAIKPTVKSMQTAAPELAAALKSAATATNLTGRNERELAELLRAVDPATGK